MSEYTFLEAALNAEGAEALRDEHASLVDYAMVAADKLVAEEHDFISDHLGQFIVHGDLDETYENVQNPVGDVVVESIAYFADVISSDELSVEEKRDYIQAGSFLIGAEQDPMDLLDSAVTENVVDSFATAAGHTFRKVIGQETLSDKSIDFKDGAMEMLKKFWDAIVSYADTLTAQIKDMPANVQEWWAGIIVFLDKSMDKLWTDNLVNMFDNKFMHTFISDDLPAPIHDALTLLTNKLQVLSDGHLTPDGAAISAILMMSAVVALVLVGLAALIWKNGGKSLSVKIIAKVKDFFAKLGRTRKAITA